MLLNFLLLKRGVAYTATKSGKEWLLPTVTQPHNPRLYPNFQTFANLKGKNGLVYSEGGVWACVCMSFSVNCFVGSFTRWKDSWWSEPLTFPMIHREVLRGSSFGIDLPLAVQWVLGWGGQGDTYFSFFIPFAGVWFFS